MPKVTRSKKSARGKEYRCARCPELIVAGQEYFTWSFYKSGFVTQHVACGYPTRSQLTQSLMGEVYVAIENVESAMSEANFFIEDWESSLREVIDAGESVVEQYREAAEHFGGQGESADKADELEGWLSDVESFSAPDRDADESDEDWSDRVKSELEEVLGNCP